MAGIKINGHCLLAADSKEPYKAQCSCGAWERVIPMRTATAQSKARRNWHDEHKRNVWRRMHPEQFQEDRPVYSDME